MTIPSLRRLFLTILAAASPASAQAATFEWTGLNSGDWATGTNWSSSVPTSATDTVLLFDNASRLGTTNNIAGGLTLNSLTLTANSGVRQLTGNKLSFDGVNPTLTMLNTVGIGNTTLGMPLQLNQTLAATGGVDFERQLIFTASGVLSGTGGLTWLGGVGAINSVSTYTGPTLISGGALGFTTTGGLGGTSSVTVASGGALQLQNNTVNKPLSLAGAGSNGLPALHSALAQASGWSGPITLAANASIGATGTSTLFVSGVISGSADLSFLPVATGVVDLNGASPNTFTGAVTVRTGTLTINNDNKFGSATNVVTLENGATLAASGNLTIPPTRNLQAGAGGFALQHANNSVVVNSVIGGNGGVTVRGQFTRATGTVTLAGNNAFGGGLTAGAFGRIAAATDSSLGAATGLLRLDGGEVRFSAGFIIPAARPMEVTANNGRLFVPSGQTMTIATNVSGAGRLNLGDEQFALGGVVTLAGVNTHSGGVNLRDITLQIDSDQRLGGASGVLDAHAATLKALGSFEIPETRSTTFTNFAIDTNNFDVTFNQPITGVNFTKQGAGVLRWNKANASVALSDNTIEAGTLRSGVVSAHGVNARIQIAEGAMLDLNNFDHTLGGISGLGAVQLGSGRLTLNGGGIFAGVISGTGAVVVQGGSVRLNGDNTFTGGLTVRNGGSVQVASAAGFGATGSAVTLDGGSIGTSSAALAPVVLDASVPFTIGLAGATFEAQGQSLIVASTLTGSFPIRVRGGGSGFEVRLTSSENTFSSNLQIGSAEDGDEVLGIVADGALGAAANTLRLGDRFFDGESTSAARGTLRAFANLNLPATRIISLDGDVNDSSSGGEIDTNGFNVTIASAIGQVRPGMRLRKDGAGRLTLNGSNTYNGETRIAGGTLSGTGTIAAVRVDAGASLAPGDEVGTLHTQSATFSNGSTFALDFASPSSADRLEVAGSVTLVGNVQLALALSYQPSGQDLFTVLSNDDGDPISGFFSFESEVLQEGETFAALGANWTISYAGGSGNDVTLAVVPEPSSVALLAVASGLFLISGRRSPPKVLRAQSRYIAMG